MSEKRSGITRYFDLDLLTDFKRRFGRRKLKHAVAVESDGILHIRVDLKLIGLGGNGDLPPKPRESVKVPRSYHVIIECDGEAQQEKAYELLRDSEFKYRLVSL